MVLERPTPAETVPLASVSWLDDRDRRFPRHMLSLIVGPPDLGKTLYTHVLAARATRLGMTVCLSNPEDLPAQITKPRLLAAGAILERVRLYTTSMFPAIPTHLNELRCWIKEDGIELLVLDPLMLHLDTGFRNGFRVREALRPLCELMVETNCTVVGVVHGLKTIRSKASRLDVVPGPNEGLAAAAQAIHLFGFHPHREEQRALVPLKSKIGEEPRAQAFAIAQVDVEDDNEVAETATLNEERVDLDFGWWEVLQASKKTAPPSLSKLEAAGAWLESFLSDGSRPRGEVIREGQQAGHTEITLRRVAKAMELIKHPSAPGRPSRWELPDDHPGRTY
jgi:hypothetical protein